MNPQSLCEAALDLLADGTPFVLVTMMDQSGSVPRTAGARMLVRPDGGIWGTVGGGRYEAEAISLSKAILRRNKGNAEQPGGECPGAVLEYSLRGVTDMDMICGGSLTLLLQMLPANIRSRELFSAALVAERKHQPFTFISGFTVHEELPAAEPGDFAEGDIPVEKGTACAASIKRFVYLPEDKEIYPDQTGFPEDVVDTADRVRDSAPHHFVHEGREYLAEFFERPFRIIIFGGGHVSLELAKLALGVDFPVIVLDDRPEFANSERFPGAHAIVPPSLHEEDSAACLREMRINPRDGIVIVTRGHSHDRDVLAAALETPAGYIGMIGSKSKRQTVYNSLKEKGITQERLDFVHSPIGLAISAETPQEIAVSIIAELIQWRKQTRDAATGKLKQL